MCWLTQVRRAAPNALNTDVRSNAGEYARACRTSTLMTRRPGRNKASSVSCLWIHRAHISNAPAYQSHNRMSYYWTNITYIPSHLSCTNVRWASRERSRRLHVIDSQLSSPRFVELGIRYHSPSLRKLNIQRRYHEFVHDPAFSFGNVFDIRLN